MIILDANVLLYAYDLDAPQRPTVLKWLSDLAAGKEAIAFPWITIWAFLRISTNARIYAQPKSSTEAFAIIHGWLEIPGVVTINPGPRHTNILEDLITTCAAFGPKVTDAALAALAIENGATIASTDLDFRRFPSIRWVNPLGSER